MHKYKVSLPESPRLGRAICGDLAQAERREWWLANGLGGYAAGTVAGTQTRCYHGLLVAPIRAPLGRALVFARAEACVVDGERELALYSNRWGGGALSPEGHVHVESFYLDGRMPVWRYALGDRRIESRVWMEHGTNTTYVAFLLDAPAGSAPLELRVKLLVNARDHHATTRPGDFNPMIETSGAQLKVEVPNAYTLWLRAPGGAIYNDCTWIENFDLPLERERGLADRDSHLRVGEARLELKPGAWTGVIASIEEQVPASISEAMRRCQERDASMLRRVRQVIPEMIGAPGWVQRLLLAADNFLVARPLPELPDGESVIAGYPWFGDWGRDTMIALPGIALATGRYSSARRILETFARFVDQGMLPNVFPGAGERPEYNTVDAALWYIEAWRMYVEASGDVTSLAKAFAVLENIVDWHCRGTRYAIGMDPADSLLRAGEPGVQLTWMDAKIGDWVVTPRIGKPVEINALWYNALRAMQALAALTVADGRKYAALAEQVANGFRRFADPESGGLYDVIDGPDGNDATLRPNQLLAVSLTYSPLTSAAQKAIVTLCGRELLTSYGLRSLAPSHPDYRPHYLGGVWERDGSYHQGPVWGWLLGHYALAHFRVYGDAAASQRLLEPIADHLDDAALGSLSEIFDGAAPHTPRGAPCQAWSVACTLEAWWRLERTRKCNDATTSKTPAATAAA